MAHTDLDTHNLEDEAEDEAPKPSRQGSSRKARTKAEQNDRELAARVAEVARRAAEQGQRVVDGTVRTKYASCTCGHAHSAHSGTRCRHCDTCGGYQPDLSGLLPPPPPEPRKVAIAMPPPMAVPPPAQPHGPVLRHRVEFTPGQDDVKVTPLWSGPEGATAASRTSLPVHGPARKRQRGRRSKGRLQVGGGREAYRGPDTAVSAPTRGLPHHGPMRAPEQPASGPPWAVEVECAAPGCTERFVKRHPRQRYHATVCAERGKRGVALGHDGVARFKPKTCPVCGREFVPAQPAQKYDRDECREARQRAADRDYNSQRPNKAKTQEDSSVAPISPELEQAAREAVEQAGRPEVCEHGVPWSAHCVECARPGGADPRAGDQDQLTGALRVVLDTEVLVQRNDAQELLDLAYGQVKASDLTTQDLELLARVRRALDGG